MSTAKEITLFTLSGLGVFVLVTLRYLLMLFNIVFIIVLSLACISFIGFLIWITI